MIPTRVALPTPGMPARFERLRFMTAAVGTEGTTGATGATEQKAMTQDEVNALVGQRVAEAQRAAKKAADDAIAARLGDRSLDDLIAAADAAKAADDAKKTEAERALEAANTTKAEAEALRATAKTELHETRVHAALIAAGVPEAGVTAVTVPDVTVESSKEEIAAAVAKLKTTLPGLFTSKVVVSSDPGKQPPPTDKAGEFGAAGKAEFERRFPPKTT